MLTRRVEARVASSVCYIRRGHPSTRDIRSRSDGLDHAQLTTMTSASEKYVDDKGLPLWGRGMFYTLRM